MKLKRLKEQGAKLPNSWIVSHVKNLLVKEADEPESKIVTMIAGNPVSPLVLITPQVTEAEHHANSPWARQETMMFLEQLPERVTAKDFIVASAIPKVGAKEIVVETMYTRDFLGSACYMDSVKGVVYVGSAKVLSLLLATKVPNNILEVGNPVQLPGPYPKPIFCLPDPAPCMMDHDELEQLRRLDWQAFKATQAKAKWVNDIYNRVKPALQKFVKGCKYD